MTRDMQIDELAQQARASGELAHEHSKLQLSTVHSMQEYVPHAILQPLGIEFQYAARYIQRSTFKLEYFCRHRQCQCHATMNDLVLAKSVFTRRSTNDDQANKQANEALLQQHQMHQLQQETKYRLRQEYRCLNNSNLTSTPSRLT